MINSVNIRGYRGLSKFEMSGLGQINLLVGKNNTGKTSVLEALYLLASGGDPAALWRVMTRRGEQAFPDPTPGRAVQQEMDVCHLFFGHELKLGATASITTTNQSPSRSITFEIVQAKREDNPALFAQLPLDSDVSLGSARLAMAIKGRPAPLAPLVPLTSVGTLRGDAFQLLNNIVSNTPRTDATRPQYISPESLSGPELTQVFGAISLTSHEARVVRSLQFLEPGLERIASVPGPSVFIGGVPTRGGFKVKLKQFEQPIPIGSMGDGIWRMLALAITLSRSKDSILLIDEIDAGLHYSVMQDMWKMVYEAAKELNVQIFATTHSNDCVTSLASICDESVRKNSHVTIQRIENGNSRAIQYSEAEITAVAEQGVEVR